MSREWWATIKDGLQVRSALSATLVVACSATTAAPTVENLQRLRREHGMSEQMAGLLKELGYE